MGEIDDAYQEKTELIEQQFFEDHKAGKKKQKVAETYRKNLEKNRKEFSKKYEKFLEKEKKRVSKPKKEKEKKEKYEHLNIEHIDLRIKGPEKMKISIKLSLFNINRTYHKLIANIFPSRSLYWYYKISISTKAFFREIRRAIDKAIDLTKKTTIAAGIWTWENIKKILAKTKKLLKKVLQKMRFWKKKEEKKEGETEEKKGEEKDEEKKP